MDLVSHVIFGAAVGHSSISALAAIAPDIPIWTKWRPERPSRLYYYTHSIWPMLLLLPFPDAALGWFSHLFLDWLSHGDDFSPRWFYPLDLHWAPLPEWEFFNRSWWLGMGVVICGVVWRMVVR